MNFVTKWVLRNLKNLFGVEHFPVKKKLYIWNTAAYRNPTCSHSQCCLKIPDHSGTEFVWNSEEKNQGQSHWHSLSHLKRLKSCDEKRHVFKKKIQWNTQQTGVWDWDTLKKLIKNAHSLIILLLEARVAWEKGEVVNHVYQDSEWGWDLSLLVSWRYNWCCLGCKTYLGFRVAHSHLP